MFVLKSEILSKYRKVLTSSKWASSHHLFYSLPRVEKKKKKKAEVYRNGTLARRRRRYGTVHDRMIPRMDDIKDGETMYKYTAMPKTVSIIGAPMTHGQPFVGTDSGPTLLREAGLLSHLSSLGWRVHDAPDLDFSNISSSSSSSPDINSSSHSNYHVKHSEIVGQSCSMLSNTVQHTINAGQFPLVIGGDHSIALGSIAGILRSRPNTGIIWVDAHADLNTPLTSTSGNMHGMPVGLLMEGLFQDHASIPGLQWLAAPANSSNHKQQQQQHPPPPPRLKPDSIVYIGLRDVDPPERKFIHALGIRAFTMHDIDRYGIGTIMDMALSHLLHHNHNHNRPLHLTYDIDAIDPIHAPATGTTVRGGLTYREAHYVAEIVARTGLLASADIVEFNPALVNTVQARETLELGLGIVTSFMGKSIL